MGFTSGAPFSFPGDPSSGTTSHIEKQVEKIIHGGQQGTLSLSHDQDEGYKCAITIGVLSDESLLDIFDFYRRMHCSNDKYRVWWRWHVLVHVCRRWRQIIFESPHRLDLQIVCTNKAPVRENLGIWPAFPIAINYGSIEPSNEDNVIAALEQIDRVSFIRLCVSYSQFRKSAMVMQKPAPVLTCLEMVLEHGNVPVLPAKFLGGSAPSLQRIYLSRIPYPTLPMLLLSASNLVKLYLYKIPPTGYISPEAMVAALAALPRLANLTIGFQSAARPDPIHLPPVSRTVLPALKLFAFGGTCEYLEDFVSRIDVPQLSSINIGYSIQFIDFHQPEAAQVSKFFERSLGPKLTLCRHAQVTFYRDEVSFTMFPFRDLGPATTKIKCVGVAWQVSNLAQVLSHFPVTLSNVVHLKLYTWPDSPQLRDVFDMGWLHLLRQFPTARTLYVSRKLAGNVALALDDMAAEMVVDVLPSLDFIYLLGQPASSIEKFGAFRRLSGHPVIIVTTETEYYDRFKSYNSD